MWIVWYGWPRQLVVEVPQAQEALPVVAGWVMGLGKLALVSLRDTDNKLSVPPELMQPLIVV